MIDRRGNASTADIIASRKCADDQLPLQTIATTTLNGIWRTHTLTSLTVMMRLDIEATVDVTPDRASTRRWSLGDERPSTFLLQALIGLFIPSQVLSPDGERGRFPSLLAAGDPGRHVGSGPARSRRSSHRVVAIPNTGDTANVASLERLQRAFPFLQLMP